MGGDRRGQHGEGNRKETKVKEVCGGALLTPLAHPTRRVCSQEPTGARCSRTITHTLHVAPPSPSSLPPTHLLLAGVVQEVTLSRQGNLTCPVSTGVVFLGHIDYSLLRALPAERVLEELEAATQGKRRPWRF